VTGEGVERCGDPKVAAEKPPRSKAVKGVRGSAGNQKQRGHLPAAKQVARDARIVTLRVSVIRLVIHRAAISSAKAAPTSITPRLTGEATAAAGKRTGTSAGEPHRAAGAAARPNSRSSRRTPFSAPKEGSHAYRSTVARRSAGGNGERSSTTGTTMASSTGLTVARRFEKRSGGCPQACGATRASSKISADTPAASASHHLRTSSERLPAGTDRRSKV